MLGTGKFITKYWNPKNSKNEFLTHKGGMDLDMAMRQARGIARTKGWVVVSTYESEHRTFTQTTKQEVQQYAFNL